MKKFILLLATLLSVRVALAQTATVQGYCVLGAAHAMTSGLPGQQFSAGRDPGVPRDCVPDGHDQPGDDLCG